MENERAQLLMLRGAIAELPEDQQMKIKEIVAQLREVISQNKDMAILALALVGAEEAAS